MVERLISFRDIAYIIECEMADTPDPIQSAFLDIDDALTFAKWHIKGEPFDPHIKIDKELLKENGMDATEIANILQAKIKEITGYEHSSLTEGEKDITISYDFRGENFNHEAIQQAIREYAELHPESYAMNIIKKNEKTLATLNSLTIPVPAFSNRDEAPPFPIISGDPYRILTQNYIRSAYQDSGLSIENAENMAPKQLR